MKKRYLAVAVNTENEQDIEALHIEAYGIKSALMIAREILKSKYHLEDYRFEIVTLIKTI